MTHRCVSIFQHVRSSTQGEKKLQLRNGTSMFVDGFHEASQTVYEFSGCTFHACPKCHPHRRNQTRYCHPDRTCEEVYEASLKKVEDLRAAGYRVIVKWECEYVKEKTIDPELKAFADAFEMVTPLEPRNAFFGGRTEAITMYAKAGPQDTITYIDVTSLYPTINKYGLYPTGFPEILFNPEDQDIFSYLASRKCPFSRPKACICRCYP